jgi:hypothetical protein
MSGVVAFFVLGREIKWDRVHTMTLIGCTTDPISVSLITWGFVSLSLEHMAEVTLASSTGDLRADHTERTVLVAGYSARDGWQKINQPGMRQWEGCSPSKKAGQPQPLSYLVVLL